MRTKRYPSDIRREQFEQILPLLEQASQAQPGHAGIQRLLEQTRLEARKVEIESLEEGREGQIIGQLVSAAVLTVFREREGSFVEAIWNATAGQAAPSSIRR